MFNIDAKTKQISVTRGDVVSFTVGANLNRNKKYVFKAGDIVRFKVIKSQDCNCVIMSKDVVAVEGETAVEINLNSKETRIGEIINKPQKYWYEVELNPDRGAQTIIGYDNEGPKIFMLYPEGSDVNA